MDGEDQELLRGVKSYDMDALGRVYDLHQPKIYRYVYARIGDQEVAEDLTGEVFIRMLRALKARRSWSTSLAAWLYGIAHHVVADYYRGQSQQDALLEGGAAASSPDPGPAPKDPWVGERLRDAVAELTDDQQKVILLKFVEGLSNREVAEFLGKTEGAVKSLQFRALSALRKRMSPDPQKALQET